MLPAQICDVPERLQGLVQQLCSLLHIFIHMGTSRGDLEQIECDYRALGVSAGAVGDLHLVCFLALLISPGCAADVAGQESAFSGWCLVGSHLMEGWRT